VHRFYLTKKKVYLLDGKLQRSREKIKPFRQPLTVWVLLLAAVPLLCRSDHRVFAVGAGLTAVFFAIGAGLTAVFFECITWYYSVI